jgi:hypothetical protein
MALGRNVAGIDISSLADFVSTAKTTVYSEAEIQKLQSWGERLNTFIDIKKPSRRFIDYDELGYYKHLGHVSRWRLRKVIEQAIASAKSLHSKRLERFARCAVLRTAQWALDGRKKLPTVQEFRDTLKKNVAEMLCGAAQLATAVKNHDRKPQVKIVNRSTAGIEKDKRFQKLQAPKLILTSPPYPGVHVLYHRWQVDGRKETPLPFMIANKLDGSGSSYYTMGDRKNPELKTYFDSIRQTMSSVARISDEETVFVQMVAFAEPEWQLERYLAVMNEIGLAEVYLSNLRHQGDGRLWRQVPNRRWYSQQRGDTPGSREVVLFHRKNIASYAASACPIKSLKSLKSSAKSPRL